jgi:hypothetical protein
MELLSLRTPWLRYASLAILLLGARSASAQLKLSEDFNAPTPSGWVSANSSTVMGPLSWHQGVGSIFPAHQGGANSYFATGSQSGVGATDLSVWLITPQLTLTNGDVLSFFTRTVSSPFFADRLQVRFSPNGASTNTGSGVASVGDFTELLLDINPNLSLTGYPTEWTQYFMTLGGLSGPTSGRLAFRYVVEDGGPDGANSDYIGIDSVRVGSLSAVAPEGRFGGLVVFGLVGTFLFRRRSGACTLKIGRVQNESS